MSTKKKQWFSIIIGTAGLISLAVTIYVSFFKSDKKEIDMTITSKNNVFELKDDIPNLQIKFEDKDLRSENQNISILNIKIANNSNADINENDFDVMFPLGFEIENGILLEKPQLINSSDDNYFPKKIDITLDSIFKNKMLLPSFILDKNASFTLKFLILHNNNDIPEIKPIGKISGINKLELLEKSKTEQQSNIPLENKQLFIIMIPSFLVVIIWLLIQGLMKRNRRRDYDFGIRSTEREKERKEKEEILKVFFSKEILNDDLKERIRKYYDHIYLYGEIFNIVDNQELLNEYINILMPKVNLYGKYNNEVRHLFNLNSFEEEISNLLDKGIINKAENVYSLNNDFCDALTKFRTFLKYNAKD